MQQTQTSLHPPLFLVYAMPKTLPEFLRMLDTLKPRHQRRRMRHTYEEILQLLKKQAYTKTELCRILDYSQFRMWKILRDMQEKGLIVQVYCRGKVYYVAKEVVQQ